MKVIMIRDNGLLRFIKWNQLNAPTAVARVIQDYLQAVHICTFFLIPCFKLSATQGCYRAHFPCSSSYILFLNGVVLQEALMDPFIITSEFCSLKALTVQQDNQSSFFNLCSFTHPTVHLVAIGLLSVQLCLSRHWVLCVAQVFSPCTLHALQLAALSYSP